MVRRSGLRRGTGASAMKLGAALGMGLALLAHINSASSQDLNDEAIQILWKSTTHNLKDPGSAYYRDTRFVRTKLPEGREMISLCGELNAKNSYGAYSGFHRFITMRLPSNEAPMVETDQSSVEIFWPNLCGDKPANGGKAEITQLPDMAQP